jgi:hypothetical protein
MILRKQPFEVKSYVGSDIAQLSGNGERPPRSAKLVASVDMGRAVVRVAATIEPISSAPIKSDQGGRCGTWPTITIPESASTAGLRMAVHKLRMFSGSRWRYLAIRALSLAGAD